MTYHLVVTLPVGSESMSGVAGIGGPGSAASYKYLRCYGGGGGRSCLERIIFSLMVILMVGVLLIAGLLCIHIGTGGLRRLSNMMFRFVFRAVVEF